MSTDIRRQRMLAQYRSVGIYITEEEGDIIVVRQREITGGFVMTQRQLLERARVLYPDKRYKIKPVVYQLDLDTVTPEWIQEQMQTYSVRPSDLVAQLGLTKSEVSLITNGKRSLSRVMRSAFFFYFLSFQLNKELR